MHFLGVAGMPRRIPDYPDAYFTFNKLASWGSYISAISSLFFFYVLFEAFSANKRTNLTLEPHCGFLTISNSSDSEEFEYEYEYTYTYTYS